MSEIEIWRAIRELERELDQIRALSRLHYSKSTWTPTYFGSATAGVTTYTTQTGVYTRLGRVAVLHFELQWTNATGTGSVRIGGLPFTPATGMRYAYGVYNESVTFANGSVQGLLEGGGTAARLFSPATNAAGTELAIEVAGIIRGTIVHNV